MGTRRALLEHYRARRKEMRLDDRARDTRWLDREIERLEDKMALPELYAETEVAEARVEEE